MATAVYPTFGATPKIMILSFQPLLLEDFRLIYVELSSSLTSLGSIMSTAGRHFYLNHRILHRKFLALHLNFPIDTTKSQILGVAIHATPFGKFSARA